MTIQKIVDASLIPADPSNPGGAQVAIVSYNEGTGAIHVVMIPTATPTLAQVTGAIQADVAWRAQFTGKTVTT